MNENLSYSDLQYLLRVTVRTKLYIITKSSNGDKEIIEARLDRIKFKGNLTITCSGRYKDGSWYSGNFSLNSLGKTLFLYQEDANAILESKSNVN